MSHFIPARVRVMKLFPGELFKQIWHTKTKVRTCLISSFDQCEINDSCYCLPIPFSCPA